MSKKNKPSIRFSKFTEEWEEKELDKIVNYTASNLTVKDALDEGKYNLYDANNVIGKTNCEPMKEEYISIIKDGAGVGRIRRLPKKSCFIGTMGALTSNGSDIDFIYALLNKYNLGSQFSGSTIPHIYFKDYGKNNYFVPEINEQKQIGECFKEIDNLLELYYSKKDNLTKLKKTLLEKMFPSSNNTAPKIRFKKYNDDWKIKTYNDLGTPLSGGSLSYDSLDESGNKKCILYGDLYTKYDCVIKNIKNRTFENGNTVIKNDILFPQSTTVDAYSLVSPACMNEDSAETSGVFVIRPISNINGNFVCYYTKGNEEQRNRIAKNGQGLTIVHLYYHSIKDEEIKIPTKSEQDDISKLFVEIDKLIELYSKKIDRFQDLKNSMLNLLII